MKHSLVVLSLMAMSGLACADGFNYTYAQANYGTVDIDNITVDGDGLGLNGSFGVTDDLNIVGSWQTVDFDSIADATEWSVGLGVHQSLTDLMDITAAVSFVNVEFDALGVPVADDDGFALEVGLRANVTSMVEVNASVTWIDLSTSGNDTGFNGGVLYNFTDTFSVGLSGDWVDDTATYSLSGRMYFGM